MYNFDKLGTIVLRLLISISTANKYIINMVYNDFVQYEDRFLMN